MRWLMLLVALVLVLAACGIGDDDDEGGSADSPGEVAQVSGENATQASEEPTAAGDSESGDENPDNPDVHVSLSAGSSGEVESDNPDPFAPVDAELGTVKVTIIQVIDPATTDSEIFQPEPGWKYWATEVTMEATGDKVVNTGVWTVSTSDGGAYETIYLTGVGEDIIYGALEAGQTRQGLLVFEIPEGASVTSLKLDPSIFAGGNLIFDA